jgi:hypothetical protein
LIKLTWGGRDTVETVKRIIDQAEQIQISLPTDYNHVLFRTLYPGLPAAEPEDIAAQGGAELLERIATISGLEELAALTGVLADARARVRVVSPPTLVLELPPATPFRE